MRAALPVLALAALPCACSPAAEVDAWSVYYRMLTAPQVEFHVPSGPLEARARRLDASMLAEHGPRARFVVDGGASDASLPRVVFGTSADAVTVDLARRIGITILDPPGFAWLGREYRSPSDALCARLADPERPGLPLVLFLGNDVRSLAQVAREIPAPWVFGVSTFRNGEPALSVRATLDGSPRLDTLVDRSAARAQLFEGALEQNLGGIRFHVPPGMPEERWRAYAQSCVAARERAQAWIGHDGGRTPEVFLYGALEDFERSLGTSQRAWANPLAPRVHVLLADGVPDDRGAELARATALDLLGEPAEPWLATGLGVAASGAWWGRELASWWGHLADAGLLAGDEELPGDRGSATWSEHVLAPLAARRFLERIETWKTAGVLAAWRGTPPAAPVPRGEAPAGTRRERALAGRAFLSGIAFHDPPPRRALSTSYAEHEALASLRHAHELGANAVSFSVRASLGPPLDALARLDERAVQGSVSDVALFQALASARALGLASVLVVQPLGAPGGTRADAFGLTDRQDTTFFFERLRWIGLHYALLAELAGADVLCLGEGLDAATDPGSLEADARAEREQTWHTVFGDVRRAFGGALTYASGSLEAAAKVPFWDALDYAAVLQWPTFDGLDAQSGEAAISAALGGELERTCALGAEVGRDVLWIQVGFPARDGAWSRSGVPRGAPDLEGQRRFYQALGRALAEARRPPFGGFFLWNLPVGAGDGGPYSVAGRPAEAEVARLLGGS